MLFKNVLAAAALFSTAFAAPTEEKRQRKLRWLGVNESGAEFGETNFTGVYGKEFTWYDLNAIDQSIAQGMNIFRLNLCRTTSNPIILGTLLNNCISDGAPYTEQARWRLRFPVLGQLDPADQSHHWQG